MCELGHQGRTGGILDQRKNSFVTGRRKEVVRNLQYTPEEMERRADEFAESLGLLKPNPRDLWAYIEGRKRLENEFCRRIFQQPGAAKAVAKLQGRRLPGGSILQSLARFAVEVQIHRQPWITRVKPPGAISFPSSRESRRAAVRSNQIRQMAREMEEIQRGDRFLEILEGRPFGRATDERMPFAKDVRDLPRNLESYADFQLAVSRLLRPNRGRPAHRALDSMLRTIVQDVLTTVGESLGSTYGVLGPLANLIGAAYHVAGEPRRISAKTLSRLLDENRT
jgi:hypothetical protein